MKKSVLTDYQQKTFGPFAGIAGDKIIVNVRFDDRCGNGHNTLGITCDIINNGRDVGGGANHELILSVMPEIEPLIEFHLCSTDGPLHYVANSTYHAKNGDLDYARNSAIWSGADLEDITEKNLLARLPVLMARFQKTVEKFGFTY
jgi:hypothetical protein